MPLFVHTEPRKRTFALRVSTCATYWNGTGFRAQNYILESFKMILRAFCRLDIALTAVTAPIRQSALKLLRQRSR